MIARDAQNPVRRVGAHARSRRGLSAPLIDTRLQHLAAPLAMRASLVVAGGLWCHVELRLPLYEA